MLTYRDIEAKELKLQKDNGYLYFLDKDHPMSCGNSGKVYYHRHVASIKLGRWLTAEEHVHHIDANKQNNEYSNLQILTNSEHTILHKGYRIEAICPTCGSTFSFIPSEEQKFCSLPCAYTASIKSPELTKEYLECLMPQHSWSSLAKLFGYSDNGIKKRATKLGCNLTLIKTYRRSGPRD